MNYTNNLTLDKAVSILDIDSIFCDDLRPIIKRFNLLVKPIIYSKIYNSLLLNIDSFIIDEKKFNCGTRVINILSGATSLAVTLITLGKGISALIDSYYATNDYLKAYWCDQLANWVICDAIKQIKQTLQEEQKRNGLKITTHCAPGYYEWDLYDQEKILDLFSDNKPEVILTESMFIKPTKSIISVIGIGKHVSYEESRCINCTIGKCASCKFK